MMRRRTLTVGHVEVSGPPVGVGLGQKCHGDPHHPGYRVSDTRDGDAVAGRRRRTMGDRIGQRSGDVGDLDGEIELTVEGDRHTPSAAFTLRRLIENRHGCRWSNGSASNVSGGHISSIVVVVQSITARCEQR